MYKYLNEVDSTQVYVKDNFLKIDNLDFVIARLQTNGYGVTGRWESNYSNLYYSQVIKKNINYIHIYALVGIYNYLNTINKDIYIKLPNDFYYNNLKLSGFLVEKYMDGYILGIGINIYQPIDEYKTSLYEINKIDYDIKNEAIKLNQSINEVLNYDLDELLKYYKSILNILNKEITCLYKPTNEYIKGVVSDINFDFITINDKKYEIIKLKFLI